LAAVSRVENRARNRRARLDSQSGILVVCGGRTEASYLAGHIHTSGSTVGMRVAYKALDPVSLVRHAARLAGHRRQEFGEVWCVVDVDEFDIAAAAQEGARRGIELAVSDPCFELWLLLHYEDCTAHLDGYPAAAQRLRKHLPAYDKASLDFRDFVGGVPAAVKRAKGLDPERNPSTGVWRLVERVMEQ
jgi:hypothetical protein